MTTNNYITNGSMTNPIKDQIQELMDKYDFAPDFIPDAKQLITSENSIHYLKNLRLKTI